MAVGTLRKFPLHIKMGRVIFNKRRTRTTRWVRCQCGERRVGVGYTACRDCARAAS